MAKRFINIAQIRAHRWAGNFHADSTAFKAVDQFALDERNPLEQRAEAWRIAAKEGMGLTVEDDPSLALPDAEFVVLCTQQAT